MPFEDTNGSLGLNENAAFQVGRANVDKGTTVEKGVLFPWPNDPATSWMYFECTVECRLDSGIVVHRRLPQVNNAPDSLSPIALDDPNYAAYQQAGVNLRSNDRYTDIVQRMAHSQYWFRLYGQALRVGFQVPIPGLKSIGGVPAIPHDENPQWAFCRPLPGGDYGGVILWHARWSLWYTTAQPPTGNTWPVVDPSAFIDGVPALPSGLQSPFSQPDDNAQPSAPAAGKPDPGLFRPFFDS